MVRDASGNQGLISINLTVIQSEPPPKVSFAEPSTRLVLGQPFQLFPDSSGGEPPVTWASSGLPRGVYFDPDSRSIVGTPEIVGSFTIALRMEDALMRSAEASCTLEVRETLAIERRTLPHAIAGMPYREDLEVRGGEPPYSWSVNGLLPAGLSIADGTLQGTPQSPGEHAFTIGVTDAWSTFVGQTYLMTVADSAGDPSVALWPIPPFGRTADDFFVYTSSIVDPITQVAWTSIAADATSLSDAAAHCAALGGDWRLPAWIELASIGGPYAAMIEAPIDAPYFAIWSADGRTWEGAGPGESGALCARADPVPAIPRYAP